MLGYVLRSVLARRRRAALTALSVFVGVAMISGAYVFADTIRAALHDLFASQASGAQVVVSSPQGLYSPTNPPASMPASLATRIARLPGVAGAQGQIADAATIVGRDGKAVKVAGSPTLALSYLPPPLGGGLQFVVGRAPSGPDEVALDSSTAARARYHVGDLVPIVTGQPARRFRVSGIARVGGASLGAATLAVFDLRTAQALYDKAGLVDAVYVAAASGTRAGALVSEINPLLPAGLAAQPVPRAVDTDIAQLSGQLDVVTGGLEAFGFIVMFVGAFVIFNTLAITVAQRTRELALLRALGATEGQVLRSVLIEAGAIGVLSSFAGLLVGPAVALLARTVFKAAGVEVPSTGLALEPRTAAIALAVGIGVTLVAGLLPGLRATRVSPVEGLRAGAGAETPRRPGLGSAGIALLLAFVGAGVALTGSGSSSARLAAASVGAVLMLLAGVLLVPLFVPVAARMLAWPLERKGGIVARLARENATRTPARTAITASSLMIGIALVLFVSVYIGGVRTTTRRAIERTFAADFAIGSADGTSPVPAVSARALGLVPNVLAVSSIRAADARISGVGKVTVSGIDTSSIGQVYRFAWSGRAQPDPAALGPTDVLLERATARATGRGVGGQITVSGPDGLQTTLTVRGIYSDRALLRGMALPLEAFDQLFHESRLQQVFVKLSPGADSGAVEAQLQQALSNLPGVVVRSERRLAAEASSKVNAVLVLFYALLAMVAVMALIGLLNALTLQVHERTRELGILRAMGLTRAQARSLIRDEGLITAALGTLVGAGLGLGLARVVSSSADIVFAVPWLQLALIAGVGMVVGVLTSLPPASRAARLDLLSALAHE